MLLILDLETSTVWNDKYPKGNPSPYLPENFLVSAGWWCEEDGYQYRFLQHNDLNQVDKDAMGSTWLELESLLYRTTLLVAHHAKFELSWLDAVGLVYKGKIADTMLREYVLGKGQKMGYSLAASCERNGVALKKSELVETYLKNKVGFDVIPMDIIEEYGLGDVKSCRELFEHQLKRLNDNPHLWPTVNLTEEFCRCLTDIERNGIKIDLGELQQLEDRYRQEQEILMAQLEACVKEVMGVGSEVNLNSPEQLSQVLYSRRVIDKKTWKERFNLGSEKRGSVSKPKRRRKMSTYDFVMNIKELTEPVYYKDNEDAISKYLYSRDDSLNSNNELDQSSQSRLLQQAVTATPKDAGGTSKTRKIAGFRLVPSGPFDAAVGGFRTDGATLDTLIEVSTDRAREFLVALKRANQIETYLSTFIAGIRRGLNHANILHSSFMQHTTATGRLSSRDPNFQNQPRGTTFPVRRCVVSRFPGGCILSGDAKQLEFRIAGELSNDEQIYKDVVEGIDVHAATAQHTGFNRQDSKAHTFAPVYGASEKGKPEHIARYYVYFKKRYWRLFQAHEEWGTEVLSTGSYILPSGREFMYPGTVRYPSGGFSNRTIIANYPVQAFATADLMPIFCIETWKRYRAANLKSLPILEVHDDVTVDVYPGELEIAAQLMIEAFNSIPQECLKRYGYEMRMPLDIELKVGPNWLEQKEYHL